MGHPSVKGQSMLESKDCIHTESCGQGGGGVEWGIAVRHQSLRAVGKEFSCGPSGMGCWAPGGSGTGVAGEMGDWLHTGGRIKM